MFISSLCKDKRMKLSLYVNHIECTRSPGGGAPNTLVGTLVILNEASLGFPQTLHATARVVYR